MWLKWLDTREAECVGVFAFDFSRAFDSVNHFILFNKLKELPVNPYIVNWIINLFITTPFLPIRRGVPQGTIPGPILFSVMLNDVQAVDSDNSTLIKFADDLTLMVLFNLTKTKEMVVKGKVERLVPTVTFGY